MSFGCFFCLWKRCERGVLLSLGAPFLFLFFFLVLGSVSVTSRRGGGTWMSVKGTQKNWGRI